MGGGRGCEGGREETTWVEGEESPDDGSGRRENEKKL